MPMWSAKTMLTALGQKSAIAEPAPHVQLAIRATLRNPQNSRKAIVIHSEDRTHSADTFA